MKVLKMSKFIYIYQLIDWGETIFVVLLYLIVQNIARKQTLVGSESRLQINRYIFRKNIKNKL